MKTDFKRYWPLALFFVIIFGPVIASLLKREGVVFFILAIILISFIIKKQLISGQRRNKNIIDIDPDKKNMIKNLKGGVFSIILVILLVWLFIASIYIVDAGETGVYSLFGKVKDEELSSGFHLVIPLAKVTRMSIRTEEYTMSIVQGEGQKARADAISSLTKEGLNVDLDITVLYRLEEEKASDLYREVGLDFAEKVIRPTIRTVIRDVIAQYEAKDIYSDKREEAALKIAENLGKNLENRGITVENVLLRNVVLPDRLAQSIQEKLQAEQEAEKYDFILEKEKKEKERKVIEAEGQRDAQQIINQSLSTNYLYYLYIKELKDREGTIYVPTNPSTGMPLFRDLGR